MKHDCKLLWIFFSIVFVTGAQASEVQRFNSGPGKVQLIELYTSEGCSSCPPADRWLSSLQGNQGLWKQFVPVAFHVDYWDYIGWKDRFAKREYSQRQRRYAAEFSEPTVYTPGVRKAGMEWRQWRKRNVNLQESASVVGNLSLEVRPDNSFSAIFSDPDEAQNSVSLPLQLSIAILGLGLESEVTRGENHGRRLEHDFVVLTMATYAGGSKDGARVWEGQLPAISKPDGTQALAIAAWITQGNSLLPIQALGGFL